MLHHPQAWRTERVWVLGLCGMVLLLLGTPLFDDRLLPGAADTDVHLQFYASRAFGFRELAAGRIAQWNPHTYCGTPYLGSMQSALLYPPNLVFLVLPTSLAISWSIALHLCLLAALTYAWARTRGIGREGSLLAGCIGALGGASFLHVYAGHLSNACTMAWTPLVFMAIDGVVAAVPVRDARRATNWCLAGAAAVAMQIYAGHPQYLFYTGVAAVLYASLVLVAAWLGTRRPGPGAAAATMRPPVRMLAATGLALCTIYPLGTALGAAQLLPGLAASRETIRSGPVPFAFAAMFGFPQENLLTLIAPFVFGDMRHTPYWGRCYLWEMCLYVGVVGAMLVVFAAWPRHGLRAWVRQPAVLVPLAMTVILLLLALGDNTPLFSVLYHHVPGFGKFRGISKFIFPAALFLAILAGVGFDRLQRDGRAPGGLVKAAFALAAIGIAGGLLLTFVDFGPAIRAMLASGECYLVPAAAADAGFQRQARLTAARAVLEAGVAAGALGMALRWLAFQPRAIHLVLALGVGELCLFASRTAVTSPVGAVPQPEIARFLAAHPGDYRVLDLTNPDAAMAGGYDNIWGYAPDLTRRYGEFIAFTQDMDPDEATLSVGFTRIDPLYRMLRLKYAFVPRPNGIEAVECRDPLPRAYLVHKYRVIKDRDAMFAAMRDPAFDPATEVLLEEEPAVVPPPDPDVAGRAEVVAATCDSLDIDVECRTPAILVVTDAFSRSWRAACHDGERRQPLDVQPAFSILRATAIPGGRHRVRFVCATTGLPLAACISCAVLGIALGYLVWPGRTQPRAPSMTPE